MNDWQVLIKKQDARSICARLLLISRLIDNPIFNWRTIAKSASSKHGV